MSPKAVAFALSSVLMLAADQASKVWVRANLAVREDWVIIPNYLSISHAKNKGAAFSALDDFEYRFWVFYAFTAVAVVVLVQGFRQLNPGDRFQSTAMGCILAGALGNFIDRVTMGEVTDMVKVYGGSEPLKSWLIQNAPWHSNIYPIWNIADAAIVIGVGMFALSYFFEQNATKDAPKDDPNLKNATSGSAPVAE